MHPLVRGKVVIPGGLLRAVITQGAQMLPLGTVQYALLAILLILEHSLNLWEDQLVIQVTRFSIRVSQPSVFGDHSVHAVVEKARRYSQKITEPLFRIAAPLTLPLSKSTQNLKKNMKRILNTLLALLFLVATVSIFGCSDGKLKTEPVRGIVTLDGEPLEGATVSFTPKNSGEGIASYAQTNTKGEYLLQTLAGRVDAGTLPGEYTVTVSKFKSVPTGRKIRDDNTGEMVEEVEGVILFPRMVTYANAKTTPFSATVVKGQNHFDFDLKSK